MKLHRRDFLHASATTAISAAALAVEPSNTVTGAEASAFPIVDTHQHLWDLGRMQPPWVADAPPVLRHNYRTKEFLAATKGLNVVKAVYMEVDVDPSDQVAEAEHVIGLSRSKEHPTVAAVISGRPASKGFEPYIRRFADNRLVKGVRQVLHVTAKPGLCLDDQFVRSMKLLGELDKSYDLCMRPRELGDGFELAKQCPDTRFIVDHCGNADPKAFGAKSKSGKSEEPWHDVDGWKRDMAAFAKLPNVTCKISGIVARAPKDNWGPETLAPIVNHCLDVFGPDRVVFGGDWPVCLLVASYRDWVVALREIVADRRPEDQRKLWHDNAVKLYTLEGSS